MYASTANTLNRGLLMNKIITKVNEILKSVDNLIEFEEQVQTLMYETFSEIVGEVFTSLNLESKKVSQKKSWKVERNDERNIQFLFGNVTYKRTLMYDLKGAPRYPLDELLGVRKNKDIVLWLN